MKIKVIERTRTTRDCTIGILYGAKRVPKGTDLGGGDFVTDDLGIQFTDDVGDTVTERSNHPSIEIVEE